MIKSKSRYNVSWNLQWLGSFPISKASLENVSKKLDAFTSNYKDGSFPVQMTISLLGVIVSKASDRKALALNHKLGRICCVVGRPELQQIAYITRESSDKRYKRQCHVFQTFTFQQVNEIEGVFSRAFHAIALFNNNVPTHLASNADGPPRCSININPALEASMMTTCDDTNQTFSMRRTISQDDNESYKSKLFSAITRSIGCSSKKTFNITPHPLLTQYESLGDIKEVEPEKEILGDLVYNDSLNEKIYPVSDHLDNALKSTGYFVHNRSKKTIEKMLLSKVVGAFLLTYSQSMRHCLTLSVNTGNLKDGNSNSVRNFVIFRNENGFKIKGSDTYHQSISALITYLSVIPDVVPIAIVFLEWGSAFLKTSTPNVNRSLTSTPTPSSCTKQSSAIPSYVKRYGIKNEYSKPIII
uniref:SH2 domain-containing protein n=1 Tax=Rhabditophanes sp. KR3021 TaxID=114890 RepID=A0AC35U7I5_9BILA